MKLYRMPLGSLGTNCYIINSESTNQCYIVDPGAEGESLVKALKEHDMKPLGVLLTHGHGDHIGGVQAIIDAFEVPVYIHEKDVEFLTEPELNLSSHMGDPIRVKGNVKLLSEGDEISWDGMSFTVIETPGHTPGGISFYGEGILLAGDTLFQNSVGRTDFPYGNFKDLEKSIREKLYVLPDETTVYPGHGPETNIGLEKQYNSFVR